MTDVQHNHHTDRCAFGSAWRHLRHAEFIHDWGQWFDLEQEVDLKSIVRIKKHKYMYIGYRWENSYNRSIKPRSPEIEAQNIIRFSGKQVRVWLGMTSVEARRIYSR